jgi:ankyrin repeat protein
VGSQVFEAVILSSRDALLDALQKGGNPDDGDGGSSALTLACVQGRDDLVGDLLRYGARADGTEEDETPPLHIAASMGNARITELLVHGGADVNATNDIRQTPLMAGAKSGNIAIVILLLQARADVSARDNNGRNALHWALVGGDYPDIVARLREAGAATYERTKDGQSPLDYALMLDRPEAATEL